MKRLAVIFTLVLASCTAATTAATQPPATTTIAPAQSTTTIAPAQSTSLPASTTTTTTTVSSERSVPFTSTLSIDVYGTGGPTVVLFHGGGWVAGSPADIAPLAEALAEKGAVVFNAPYRLTFAGGGYPMTFEDAACAIRFASEHSADFGGDPSQLIVIGHSAGAHIAAVVALAADTFDGDCLVDMNDTLPTKLVGLAGPYNTDALGSFMEPFFGADPNVDPEPWRRGNPFTYLDRNPGLVVRLVHGDQDQTVPLVFSQYFEEQLSEHGYDVTLTIVPGAGHSDVWNPLTDGDFAVEVALG